MKDEAGCLGKLKEAGSSACTLQRERDSDVKSVEFVGDLLTVPGVRALQETASQ